MQVAQTRIAMKCLLLSISLLFLTSCFHPGAVKENQILSMQIIDRNGFSETISSKDRLSSFETTDFCVPQPYQKVVRIFGKSSSGNQHSKITSYHPNGQLYQYLDVLNNRAHGYFREWHPNGVKKIECYVIEGTPDINELAQTSWVFDQKSFVWDEDANLIAEINYDKGSLEGLSSYYHPNGQLEKSIPYQKNLIHGLVSVYDKEGELVEKIEYKNGLKEGTALGYWNRDQLCYQETYTQDLLMEGSYFTVDGIPIAHIKEGSGKQALFKDGKLASLTNYKKGIPEGRVELFSPEGHLSSVYHILNGQKSGEELIYFPPKEGKLLPKLSLQWHEDTIQGIVKTWYENGILESQKEHSGNKKHGLSFAWYQDGSLMFMEEYDNDNLIKGSYLKKGDKKPVSKVENGKGAATIYDGYGHFQKKIIYEKGLPNPVEK